jgi:hypothetical protein
LASNDQRDFLAGKISKKEYQDRTRARAAGALPGFLLAIGAEALPAWDTLVSILGAEEIAAGSGVGSEIAQRVLNDSNKMNHIFEKADHDLGEITEVVGSRANLVNAVADRVASLQSIPTDAIGVFKVYVSVSG